ncbi:MAG: mechanosensitive ion channel family protein [Acholeplasmatales bacterium]|nr:mechanosensitive ion channel family protein [Acholeplasmatales bacterium]
MEEKEKVIDKETGLEAKVLNKNGGKTGWWKRKTKGEKISFIAAIFIFAVSITALVIWIHSRQFFGDEVGDMFVGEGNYNGWVMLGNFFRKNAFKAVLMVVTVCITFLVVFILNGIINLTTQATRKSRTVGALIRNLIKYIAVIVDVIAILALMGVDTVSIFAGVNVLALIVGLGCQSLIKDIVAGLFIVFDDYFVVGEMVIIDGFRGYVTDVGLRTTKLDDKCGNLKSISNSNIGTCVNLSRSLNLVSVSLGIGYNEDLERVEAIIARELPKIKEKIPMIVEGPTYRGVVGMGDSDVTLGFGCKCLYKNRFQVERDLRREIYQLYVKNDILIPYNQITINPQDPQDRPEATEEDIKLSSDLVNKNRVIVEKEKETFFKRAKDSFSIDMPMLEDQD